MSKYISLRNAVEQLRLPGARLMKMCTREGVEHFVMPNGRKEGGRVTEADVATLMRRNDLIAFEDGLFPGNSQGWRLG